MRAEKIPGLSKNIEETTPLSHRVLWACTVGSRCYTSLCGGNELILVDGGGSWGERINTLFFSTRSPYVFLGADDVIFHDGWLDAALETMQDVDGVVAVNDLHNPNGTLALVSRRYIEEESGCIDVEGVVIYPGYFHNYSETELFETAKSRGRFAYCEESVVEHLHPDAGKAEKDEIYQLGMAHLVEDQDLFFSRRLLWV